MMKKSTKLLSVILAIVMLFTSMSVMVSAYRTSSELENMQAYSPYGTVTRLETNERLAMVIDYLDLVLADLNFSMAEPIPILNLTIDLRSVNAALGTVDGLANWLNDNRILVSGFGDLADLDMSGWQTGMTRETPGTDIVANLTGLLSDNAALVQKVLGEGLSLGSFADSLLGTFGVDLGSINTMITGIPGLIKGLITPMLERKDDTVEWAETLAAASSMDSILTSFVQGLFTKPQSTTTVKADSTGALQSNHDLPTAADGLRYYYVAGANASGQPTYTCYVYNVETDTYDQEEEVFVLTEEVPDSGVYVFEKPISGETLKYYEPDSYWLPSLVESGSAADIMNISTNNGVNMLYSMIPYVFGEMAPVVLNGSVKKVIGEWFGASYNYVGEVGSSEVAALGDDVFFKQPQGEYLWEWSDYAVIDGVHYYRFEDSIYKADLSNCNAYMDIVNWNYEIPANLLDKYIPQNGDKSQAGYNTILKGLNDFFGEVVGMVLAQDVVTEIGWTTGSNENLLENVKKTARVLVTEAPEAIFGEHWEDDAYYNLMVDPNTDDQTILCCIAAKLLEFLMPQLILPDASSLEGQPLGAMLAMVIRELATQLIPTYNYDALIFAEYNTKTLLSGKDNSYWLDVCLTMGVDIGMSYLRNLADLGEDTEVGYDFAASKTYDYNTFIDNPQAWEASVDWVIDWALTSNQEWTWKMSNLVDCGDTVDLATAQDPWVKLGNILKNLLPIDQILNVNTEDSHWLETALRTNFVEALLNLDLPAIVGSSNEDNGVLMIPTGSVLRSQALLPMVINVVRDLLNDLLRKVGTNDNSDLLASSYNSLDSVFNGIPALAGTLLPALDIAVGKGLLDTAMPFLNFFIGWTTDAQTYQDPIFMFSDTTTGGEYLQAQNGQVDATLRVTNNSLGMLLKHGNTYDVPYDIYVTGITTSDPNLTAYMEDNTSAFTTHLISPWDNYSFRIRGAYTQDEAICITVTYYFIGKNNQPLGGERQMNVYSYVTNATAPVNTYQAKSVTTSGIWQREVLKIQPSDTPRYIVFISR